jgi:hypothetical protein
MHRTLFTPSMVETFRICRKAYQVGQAQYEAGVARTRLKSLLRRFIMRGLAEINRGKLTTVNQVQRFMGQQWPADKLSTAAQDKDNNTRAFLFAYKTLTKYVGKPYRASGSEIVGVAQKVRARVPHVRVYVEDTIDLMIWHPHERRLELIDFQLTPISHLDPAWPSPTVLVKQFLAEKLKMRFPYERVSLTFVRVGTQDHNPISLTLDESIFRLHWSEMVKTLEAMKESSETESVCSSNCRHCEILEQQQIRKERFERMELLEQVGHGKAADPQELQQYGSLELLQKMRHAPVIVSAPVPQLVDNSEEPAQEAEMEISEEQGDELKVQESYSMTA